LNKIAYIGQSAAALYDNIPNTVTMECWSLLSEDIREKSNLLAKEAIDNWEIKNKRIQLCLNLD
jgi:hypothetical protein